MPTKHKIKLRCTTPHSAKDKKPSKLNIMKEMLIKLSGTGKSEILDESLNIIKETDVENLYDELKQNNPNAKTIIFDGVVSQRLADISSSKGIENLVAFKSGHIVKKPENLRIITVN